MKLMPTSNAFSTHALAPSASTPTPYVSHDPRLISETRSSLRPSWRYSMGRVPSTSVTSGHRTRFGVVAEDDHQTARRVRRRDPRPPPRRRAVHRPAGKVGGLQPPRRGALRLVPGRTGRTAH